MGVLRGIGLSTAVAALAWPLAMIYRQPELLPVLLLLAARPALMALRSPALPVLRRQMNYRILFFDEVAQNVAGTAITLALVWQFRSVWSIAMGGLVGAAASVAISYALCPMRPLWGWDRSAARELSHTGRQILVNTLVMSIWMNLDRLLGLRLLEPQQLGLYTVAWNLAAMAEALIGRAAGVYFSMLVSTEDAEARAAQHRRFSRYLVVWIMPAMGLGIVAAPLAVDLLYDSRYGGARSLLAILTARLMFRCLGHFQFQYLMALGLIRLETRSYAVGALFQALALVPLVRMWGVTGMALSGLLSAAVQAGTQAVLMRLHSRAPLAPLLVTTGWAAAGLLTALLVDWLSSP
jgi:O-antigen/teichoic acid export membrane protein